jgi:tetratricopeptide (TPR) repeat protein
MQQATPGHAETQQATPAHAQMQQAIPGHADYIGGCQLLADRKLAEAVTAFDQAIAVNPQHSLAVFTRAKALQGLGKTDLAVTGYAEAIRLHEEIAGRDGVRAEFRAVPLGGELVQAYFNRATLLNRAGKPDEAIQDFTEALRHDPKYADAYSDRGVAFLEKGLFELAIDDLTEAIRLAPHAHEAICRRARAWLAAGSHAKAIEDARMAFRLNAKCGDAFRTLGSALLSSPNPQPDRAIEYLKEAISLDGTLQKPVNSELAQGYVNWGYRLKEAGKGKEADAAFDEAKRLDPGIQVVSRPIEPDLNPNELYRQATASLEQGKFDKALGEFTKILDIDAKWADAWCGRGSAFLGKGFPDSAIQDFDRALRLAPDSAQAYCQRGRAYTEMCNYGRAIGDTTEAIRLKPDLAPAYFHRAVAYLKDNRPDRTLADLAEAVGLDPKLEVPAQSLYAETYQDQGIKHIAARRWDEAIASFEKAISFEKNRARQLDPLLAQAYGERGFSRADHPDRFPEAVRDLKRAYELDKGNAQTYRFGGLTCCKMARACRARGLTASEKGQWEAAIHNLQQAIRLDPDLEYQLRPPLEDARRNVTAIAL